MKKREFRIFSKKNKVLIIVIVAVFIILLYVAYSLGIFLGSNECINQKLNDEEGLATLGIFNPSTQSITQISSASSTPTTYTQPSSTSSTPSSQSGGSIIGPNPIFSMSCYDDDGGVNYGQKGTVFITITNSGSYNTFTLTDKCDFIATSPDYVIQFFNFFSKNKGYYLLTEYYCLSSNSMPKHIYKKCSKCINSACVS